MDKVNHREMRERLKNPLTDEHKSLIDDHLETLRHVKDAHRKAKLAGIDVSDSEKMADEAEAKLKALKSIYFPNG